MKSINKLEVTKNGVRIYILSFDDDLFKFVDLNALSKLINKIIGTITIFKKNTFNLLKSPNAFINTYMISKIK